MNLPLSSFFLSAVLATVLVPTISGQLFRPNGIRRLFFPVDNGQRIEASLERHLGHDFGPGRQRYYNQLGSTNVVRKGDFGQPSGASDHPGPTNFDSVAAWTPEDVDMLVDSPTAFSNNPVVRHGLQGLQLIEANYVRVPRRNELLAKASLPFLTNQNNVN